MNEEETSNQQLPVTGSPPACPVGRLPETGICLSARNPEIKQSQTPNSKFQTAEKMDVHHHSHTPGKKWTHYFWEFLMLFLAVFCGFLAEYQLEHIIEHQREKIYIRSMIEDLKSDTANFSVVINNFLENEARLEIVLRGFEEGRKNNSENWAGQFVYSATMGFADFFYTDRTLQQLKNSGGMRLIRSEEASSGIIQYDAAIKDLNAELRVLSETQEAYMEMADKVWSFEKMFKDQGVIKWQWDPLLAVTKNYWTTSNQADFEYLYNKGSRYYDIYFWLKVQLEKCRKGAIALISLLTKEYHIK